MEDDAVDDPGIYVECPLCGSLVANQKTHASVRCDTPREDENNHGE